MSHIFDALQRSEAERSGGTGALASITELLERAEQGKAVRSGRGLAERDYASDHGSDLAPDHGSDLASDLAPAGPLGADAERSARPEAGPPTPATDFAACATLTPVLPDGNRLVTLSNGDSPAAEAFRLLGVRLRHLRRDRELKRLLITSTVPQEGKSTVSANLACTLASATRRRVLLLEGDIRRPTLSRVFGLAPEPGLCEWLKGARRLEQCVYRLEPGGLWFCPAGAPPANPLELLESGRLPRLLDEVSAWFDWVVIDSPPVLPLADTSVWARLSDGVLLVTRQGTTQKHHLKRGLEAIEPRKLLGTVINSSRSTSDHEYYSYRRPAEGGA